MQQGDQDMQLYLTPCKVANMAKKQEILSGIVLKQPVTMHDGY
jgi:hypothetical protein